MHFPVFRQLHTISTRFLYVKVDGDAAAYSSFSSFLDLFRIFLLFLYILPSISRSATFRKSVVNTYFWTFERYEFIISVTNMDSLSWWIALGINHMFASIMISFSFSQGCKFTGSSWTRHKRASCFSERKDLISYLVETFDGRDRHVLSSLLVFLRSFCYICKSVNWISASEFGGGYAIGPCLLLVGVSEWITEHATWKYYTIR